MAKKRAHYVSPPKKWGIHNPPHPWQSTTIPPAALLPSPSNKNGQRQLTCDVIGSAIGFAKANFKFIGAKSDKLCRLLLQTSSNFSSSSHSFDAPLFSYNPTQNYFECFTYRAPTPSTTVPRKVRQYVVNRK